MNLEQIRDAVIVDKRNHKPKFKHLVALPCFKGSKGFNHQTILVSASNTRDTIAAVRRIKGYGVNIGDIKKVNY